ncbi:MSHA pilin protein mshA [Vibrio ishigakensis]|uniref:MSHA pilin protein mshA n=1 Tax=Vibrio ishigakensis TaxID=1481914 RepID=A0A0B8PHB4_9VIBR|nr:MSHA pilin protein mshA [Vibrio ishigakensis]
MRVKGFTLIELVVVIVLLGVIAVVAAPRYLDFRVDGKIAVMNNFASALRSGVDLVHAKAVIQGQEGKTGKADLGNGTNLDLAYGYPDMNYGNLDSHIAKLSGWLDAEVVNRQTNKDWPREVMTMDRSQVGLDGAKRVIQFFFMSDSKAGLVNSKFECMVQYQNATESSAPIITTYLDAC